MFFKLGSITKFGVIPPTNMSILTQRVTYVTKHNAFYFSWYYKLILQGTFLRIAINVRHCRELKYFVYIKVFGIIYILLHIMTLLEFSPQSAQCFLLFVHTTDQSSSLIGKIITTQTREKLRGRQAQFRPQKQTSQWRPF